MENLSTNNLSLLKIGGKTSSELLSKRRRPSQISALPYSNTAVRSLILSRGMLRWLLELFIVMCEYWMESGIASVCNAYVCFDGRRKHWPQSSPHSSNAYLYFDQDVGILNSLRDVCESLDGQLHPIVSRGLTFFLEISDPIAASWCDGIQHLHLLYHNLVRGVIAGDPNKVRQSVIRLLRTVKEDDSGSPARESRSNSEGTIGLSSLGMGSHSANGAGLNLTMSSIHESQNGGSHSNHDGQFRLAVGVGGVGVGDQNGENPFAGTGSDTMDHSSAASPSQGMHMQRGLDLETEYQLDDFVPSDSILFDWSSFSLLGESFCLRLKELVELIADIGPLCIH